MQITPYIHIFSSHLFEMIRLHGNISLFSMQGLEKLNDLTTMAYFSSTNKHNDFLVQLIQKRNRLELMDLWTENDLFFELTVNDSDSEDEN